MPQRNYNGETMRTITKAELIEALSELNDDDKVIFSSDYGDYHHTQQALPLRGQLEEVQISKSAYSHSGFEIVTEENWEDADARDPEDGEAEKYFVIR